MAHVPFKKVYFFSERLLFMKTFKFFIALVFVATLPSIVLEAAKKKSGQKIGAQKKGRGRDLGVTQSLQALSLDEPDEQKPFAGASSLSEAVVEFKLPDDQSLTTELDFSGCPEITGAGFKAFAPYFENLIRLELGGCKRIASIFFIIFAQRFKNLRYLNLSGCVLTDAAFKVLAPNLIELTYLDLSRCKNITDDGLTALILGLRNLTYLDLRFCEGLSLKFQKIFREKKIVALRQVLLRL